VALSKFLGLTQIDDNRFFAVHQQDRLSSGDTGTHARLQDGLEQQQARGQGDCKKNPVVDQKFHSLSFVKLSEHAFILKSLS
jgi:hypothetical protein